MIPQLDPQKMERMLRQLGIKTEPIPATEVIIKTSKGDIKITNPQVIKTTMKGQVVFQVSGNVEEDIFSEEDIKLVMEQSGVEDEKKVKEALAKSQGDIVNAIMELKKTES